MYVSTSDRYGRISVSDCYDKVLLYDTGEHDRKTLMLAANVAAENGAMLTVVEIIPHGIRGLIERVSAFSAGQPDTADRSRRQRRLDRWLSQHLPSSMVVTSTVLDGDPSFEISRLVLTQGYDLVFVAEPKHPSLDEGYDAATARIAHHCPCPVWVVKRMATGLRSRVAAAIGCWAEEHPLDAIDRQIVTAAVNIARPKSGRLDIIRPWDFRGRDFETSRSELPPAMYREFYARHHHARADGVKRMLRGLGFGGSGIVIHLPHGSPEEAVIQFVEKNDIDVLVIGVDDESGLARLFHCPYIDSVLAHVHCSVMIVKGPSFASPVHLADSITPTRRSA